MEILDHVGIAVEDLDESIAYYKSSFGYEVDLREEVPSQKVEVAFLKLANTKLELLASTDDSSTLKKFINNRGPGMHHICFKVDDIRAELSRLKSEGFQLIDEEPRPGAHNTLIAFIHPKSTEGVLIELAEYQ